MLLHRKMMSVERPDLEKLGITSSMLGYSSNTPPANAKWSSPTNNKPQENASIDTMAENGTFFKFQFYTHSVIQG